MRKCVLPLLLLLLPVPLLASESDALAISATIRERHLPYGMILGPVYDTPESTDVISYSRCGDSAIWTGHWLAAEAYRYAVTKSPEALENVRIGLDAVRKLLEVTGNGQLARCAFPVDSPYATDMSSEEQQHGVFRGRVDGNEWIWIGDTSRDQYLGVFFGLTATYNLIDDPSIKGAVNFLASKAVKYLTDRGWIVWNPNGQVSTTFLHRADHRLAVLKLVRRTTGSWDYKVGSTLTSPEAIAAVGLDTLNDHESYFKFNLDYVALYCLLTGGDSSWVEANYRKAFSVLRNTTDDHENAFFNMIERAVDDRPNPDRDGATRRMLDEWLTRPRRDFWVDLRDKYLSCGEDRACEVLPVPERVRTDFLWQRSPFLLYGGGSGRIESAGIDYILPYWMARYYHVIE